MDSNLSKWTLISLLSFVVMNPQVLVIHGLQQFPCLYILGDSLFDPGNNNKLNTTAKVNYPPYGIDFQDHNATGRFSNGCNIGDYFAKYLGFETTITPYTDAKDGEKVVNYASGGSGILNETGMNLGQVISLYEQIQNHTERISRENQTLTGQNLGSCLYSLNSGNNDYIQNYYGSGSLSRNQYTTEEFANFLTQQYSFLLETLYDEVGARKFVVFNLLPSGCTPELIQTYGTNGSACVEPINAAVKIFNNMLKQLIQGLNKKLSDAILCYIDTYSYVDLSLLNSVGITIPSTPCCNTTDTTGLCIRDEMPCPPTLRSLSAYWDGYHPTATIAEYIASRSYGDLEECLKLTSL